MWPVVRRGRGPSSSRAKQAPETGEQSRVDVGRSSQPEREVLRQGA